VNGTATDYSAAFLDCLKTLDVGLMRKLWRHLRPNQDQPQGDAETLATLHLARTECRALKANLRMYSHSWLTERALPSLLPDHMRASAMRMYPITARAVGISVNSKASVFKPALLAVRTAMETAVKESFADNDSDDMMKRHMEEARHRALGKLLGIGTR
jgi:vacuolar-type H+-ATPase subunit C/Vma6